MCARGLYRIIISEFHKSPPITSRGVLCVRIIGSKNSVGFLIVFETSINQVILFCSTVFFEILSKRVSLNLIVDHVPHDNLSELKITICKNSWFGQFYFGYLSIVDGHYHFHFHIPHSQCRMFFYFHVASFSYWASTKLCNTQQFGVYYILSLFLVTQQHIMIIKFWIVPRTQLSNVAHKASQ